MPRVYNEVQNGAAAPIPNLMLSYDDINTFDTSAYGLDEIMALDSVKLLLPDKEHSRFCSNRALANSQNVQWQETSAYVNGQATRNPEASTSFRFEYPATIIPGSVIGYFKVTYYVTFRGQARN